MKDMVSCFSENSVNVTNACKSYSKNACLAPELAPSVQNAVVSVYRMVLSSGKHHFATVTWCRTGLGIDFGPDPSSSLRLSTTSRVLRKQGSKPIGPDGSKVEALWDLSTARFGSGPEPVGGFYVLVTVDSEVVLVLGDRFPPPGGAPAAGSRLISRREHWAGDGVYSTRARFGKTGITHELVVGFGGPDAVGSSENPMLSVWIDGRVVVRVKKLRWNFRGDEMILVDGLWVDVMWDVHKWLFGPVGSEGVLMFMTRSRSGVENRLGWVEDKLLEDTIDFSLFICAIRNS